MADKWCQRGHEMDERLFSLALDLAYVHVGDNDELGEIAREIIKLVEESRSSSASVTGNA